MSKLQYEPVGEIYEIKLKGHLNESWADWFDGLVFTHESDGTTALTGEIIDQAALHGLLKKARGLGMPLISVNRIGSDQTDGADVEINSVSDIRKGVKE
ncbi:MAG: hypothetical protein GY805_19190 [Chloroflexi bacterium]|nr:hypothetical protein [Chloroflexota bacterium]